MISQAKIAANRANGRKSRGPHTAAGKSRASRNAFRHGLSTISRDNPLCLDRIERLARAYCADDDDPLLLEQARIIAEDDIILMCVRAKRVSLFERIRGGGSSNIRSGTERAGRKTRAMNGMRQALEFAEAEAKEAEATASLDIGAPQANEAASAPAAEKAGTPSHDGDASTTTITAMAGKHPTKEGGQLEAAAHLDEVEAMEEMLDDLHRLEWYESRAISRRDQAIREFTWIASLREFQRQSQKQQDQPSVPGHRPVIGKL
jgi:hypothetical protein